MILNELATKGDLDVLNRPVTAERCVSPFESGLFPQMPSHLYFTLVCETLNIDYTRSLVALVLTDRIIKKQ